jgi:hypothetical protein
MKLLGRMESAVKDPDRGFLRPFERLDTGPVFVIRADAIVPFYVALHFDHSDPFARAELHRLVPGDHSVPVFPKHDGLTIRKATRHDRITLDPIDAIRLRGLDAVEEHLFSTTASGDRIGPGRATSPEGQEHHNDGF